MISCSSATPEQTNLTFGWGLRFQLQPSGPPNDILLHINLRDASNLLQPDALGRREPDLSCPFYQLQSKESFLDGV